MNEFQKAYAEARAHYETAITDKKDHLHKDRTYQRAKQLGIRRQKDETPELREALQYTCLAETDADKKFYVNDLAKCLVKSEDILLDKFQAYITSRSDCPAQVHGLFEKWKAGQIRLVKQKQALVDIAMRCNAW